jgi:hypothetical protein
MGCPFGACEGGIDKTVETGLLSKPIEFDGIKTGVVDLLPEAEEFEGVAVAQPVADQVVGVNGFLVAGDVGQADVILVVDAGESDFAGENFDFFRHGFSRCSGVP